MCALVWGKNVIKGALEVKGSGTGEKSVCYGAYCGWKDGEREKSVQDEWRRRTALLSLCGSAIPSRAWGKGKFLLYIVVLFFKSNIYLVLDDCVPFWLPDNISKAAHSKHSKERCDDTACTCAMKKRPQVAANCTCFFIYQVYY